MMGDLFIGHANNFDFLRFIFATLVIWSHSYAFSSRRDFVEPLSAFTQGQAFLGGIAVHSFFLLSGFLVTASWLHSRNLWDFLWRRVLRIYPAYVVWCFVAAGILGPLGAYSMWHYADTFPFLDFIKAVLFLDRLDLPGTFRTVIAHGEVSGALWTIKIEFECYILTAVLGLIGLWRHPRWAWMALLPVVALYVFTYLAPNEPTAHAQWGAMLPYGETVLRYPAQFRFGTYYLIGAMFLIYRDRIPHSPLLLLLSLALFAVGARTHTGYALFPPTLAYMLFWVAFHPRIRLHNFGKRADLSYGLYLYGFPCQLLTIYCFTRDWNPHLLTLVVLPPALLCAALSWFLVEKPAIELKRSSKPSPAPAAL